MSTSPTERLNDPDKDKKNLNNKNKKNNGKPSAEEKFEGSGVNFKGKLIGFESVSESKGEKMCQVAMAKLKAGVLALGEHKEKITINLSMDGVSLFDDKMEGLLHRHSIEKISFVSRDASDSRAFGYVFDENGERYRFCAIKTEKSAEPVMTTMKELFQVFYEKQESKSNNEATTADSSGQSEQVSDPSVSNTDQSAVDGTATTSDRGAESILLETKTATTEIFEASQSNLIAVDSDMLGLNINIATSAPTHQTLSTSPLILNQLSAVPGNPSFLTQTPPRLPPPPPPSHFGHSMTSPFPGATIRGVAGNQVPFAGQFGSPAVAFSPQMAQQQQQQQQQSQYGNQTALLFQQPQPFYNTPFGQTMQQQMPFQQQQQQPHQQQQPYPQQNNGWTSFDMNQQQQQPFKQPVMNNPFASALPYSSQQQLRPQQSQQNMPRSASSESDFNTITTSTTSSSTNVYDPFRDLALLNTKPNPLMKKPTKEDFVKEPPKPSLHDLAGQQQQKQQFLPPQPQQPIFNDFNLVSNNGANNNSNNVNSPFGSYDGSEFCGEVACLAESNRQPLAIVKPSLTSYKDSQNNNSSPNLFSPPGQLAPNPAISTALPFAAKRSRPINIDFSAQRFSPLEDRRSLAKPTVIDWLSEDGTKTKPASPLSLPGSLETKDASPARSGAQRFCN